MMGVLLYVLPLVALIVTIYFSARQIRASNSLRRTELIYNLYDAFLDDKLATLYTTIRNGQPFAWEQPETERLLNRAFTLFDKIELLRTEGVLKGTTMWEYFASEIQTFAAHHSVWDYLAHRIRKDKARGFKDRTIAFTGFVELYRAFPDTFKADPFPSIPERHRPLFDSLDWSA
jgi:hypothetical protein